MFVNGVKITLIVCLTIIVSCILFISYMEYTSRYSIFPTSDNSLYIFDKKSTVLSKCNDAGCKILDTKLPIQANGAGGLITSQIMEKSSSLFGGTSTMTSEMAKAPAQTVSVEAKKAEAKPGEGEKSAASSATMTSEMAKAPAQTVSVEAKKAEAKLAEGEKSTASSTTMTSEMAKAPAQTVSVEAKKAEAKPAEGEKTTIKAGNDAAAGNTIVEKKKITVSGEQK
ncbi:MAG: hypothetical protein LBI26_01265 [Holosporales bacterium]|nr:hypothetical protein [Holosporales bacterium]